MKGCLAVPGKTRFDCRWVRKLSRTEHRVNKRNLKNNEEECSLTKGPTSFPTEDPLTASPTDAPSDSPTGSPTTGPTSFPTEDPLTASPTDAPSDSPTGSPTVSPTASPTNAPSIKPSRFCFDDAGIVGAVTSYFENKEDVVREYGEIGLWATCRVTNLDGPDDYSYFFNINFNQDLNEWDLSSVTSLHSTFRLGAFNSCISSWDVSLVENCFATFNQAYAFNQDLNVWDISSSLNFNYMFYYAKSFNQCLEWSPKSEADTEYMFQGTDGRLGPC
eukprot:CAMPEP_0194298774 /NCGR_PEP_ID=MMETSP0169-20130528/60350_1 /TAXON_ID=218684 /ORGANISM="Corethron pennatum, Strain L29A3" /LENGTH=274 /DNA_ID=CAMNT_0039048797 /DNA_START=449 /DNA_END=1273 /DNA_ORIENTATION=+